MMNEVDSHFHVWDLNKFSYSWPDASLPAIFKDISLSDFSAALHSAGVNNAVFVQTLNNNIEEAKWVLKSNHPAVKGVVSGVSLTDHALLKQQLDELCKFEAFVGVRHIIDMEADQAWLIRDDVIQALEMVAARDKSLDIPSRPHNLHHVATLAAAVPQLRIVVDHIAKPLLSRSLEICPEWKKNIEAAAACPNVFCKISGLVTEVDPVNNSTPWSVDTFQEHVDVVLAAFGVDRCMIGSDWPVLWVPGSNYKEVNQLHKSLIAHLSESEQNAILGSNAVRFYKLKGTSVTS